MKVQITRVHDATTHVFTTSTIVDTKDAVDGVVTYRCNCGQDHKTALKSSEILQAIIQTLDRLEETIDLIDLSSILRESEQVAKDSSAPSYIVDEAFKELDKED